MPDFSERYRERLQSVLTLYLPTKESLREADTFAGDETHVHDHVRLANIRNGLDDLVVSLEYALQGNETEALRFLDEVVHHLRPAAYEGWICSASRQLKELKEKLSSFWVSGGIGKAQDCFQRSIRLLTQARNVADHEPQAAVLAKEATMVAREGNQVVHLLTPRDKVRNLLNVVKILIAMGIGILGTLVGLRTAGII